MYGGKKTHKCGEDSKNFKKEQEEKAESTCGRVIEERRFKQKK